jgi:hypothetical protein
LPRIGRSNNPGWERKFRAVSDTEAAKNTEIEGTKSGLDVEIRPRGRNGINLSNPPPKPYMPL